MSLPGKILLALGVICGLIGLIAKLSSISQIDGASLIVIGILYIVFAIGMFDLERNKQSNKRKVLDWVFFGAFLIGGILSYLK